MSGKEPDMKQRAEILKEAYGLQAHVEGGFFSEVYTAPFEQDGRSICGSIYFLLDSGEISRFHVIDCDEIWYYHEGCGMKITVLTDGKKEERLLGNNVRKGESPMAVIPKGCAFAAENLEPEGYTFVSCVTTPGFEYAGFRLIGREELRQRYPDCFDEMAYLAAD